MKILYLMEAYDRLDKNTVYDTMLLTAKEPNNVNAYGDVVRGHCHSSCLRYINEHGKPSDYLLLLGRGNNAYHSIVVDKQGKLLFDNQKKTGWDGNGTYNTPHGKFKVVKHIQVQKFRDEVKRGS